MAAKTRPCEICMKPIEAERLETIPETRLCLEHAEKIKKFGGEFVVTSTQERTSKPGSLKKNYGGVTPSMKRNHKAIEKLKDELEEEKWQKKD
jgi:ribosome biogenesis SPOUT family RNA methylase Rps3